jgi:hypothetical protein
MGARDTFDWMRLLCTVLFLSVVFASPASAQSSGGAWEFGLGPHVLFRESSSKANAGGGVTVARRYQKIAAVVEASGTRREGHNDWRAVAGPRVMFGAGSRASVFLHALGGTLIRQREAEWAVLPGFGIDVRSAGGRAIRLQFDAPIERSGARTVSGIRGSVWFVF